MTRRGFIDHDKKAVYFWSPKSESTSLFKTLQRTYGPTDDVGRRGGSSHWASCLEVIEKQGYRSAAFVRNPYDRMISCYINEFVYQNKPLVLVQDLRAPAHKHYQVAAGKNPIDLVWNEMSFDTFLNTIVRQMRAREDADASTIDGHWDTQIPPAMTGFEYDTTVRVENFAEDFAAFCREFELDDIGAAQNATPYEVNADGYLGDQPASQLMRRSVAQLNFRSRETDRRIAKWYADDFATLGYAV